MTATCPICEKQDCKVKEDFMQATRKEPQQSLGHSAYCPSCQVAFKVASAQMALAS